MEVELLDVGSTELAAVRASFCNLVARWRLTQRELSDLLQMHGALRATRVLPDVLDVSAETRVRLLLRLDHAIATMCDGVDVCALLREPQPFNGRTPLHDLSELGLLRAAVQIAESGNPSPAMELKQ